MVNLWKDRSIGPVFTKETFAEFRGVLHYPKFSLREDEMRAILEDEVLPFFEAVEIKNQIEMVWRDSQDDKFIACAIAAQADYIVSDDEDLLVLKKYEQIKIIFASEFLKNF
jgi:uncharacterized protein